MVRKDGAGVMVGTAACRRWTCVACVSRLRLENGVHYGRHILKAGGAICRTVVSGGRWGAAHRAILRAGADYAKVGLGRDAAVYSTGRIPNHSVEFLPAPDAVRALGHDLAAVRLRAEPRRGRPVVSGSRGWCVRRHVKPSEWERAAEVKVSDPSALRKFLTGLGIQSGSRRSADGAWGVTWRWPDAWTPGERAAATAGLMRRFGPLPGGEE